MPIYEYRCQECQQIFEQWQKDFNDKDKTCPVCGGKSQRLISNTSFVLKGSGWYVTDYSGNAQKAGGNGQKTEQATTTAEAGAKDKDAPCSKSGASSAGTPASE